MKRLLAGLLLIGVVGCGSGSPTTESSSNALAQEALSLAKSAQQNSEFFPAHDLLLVAIRLNPQDPELFSAVCGFVETTASAENLDIEALAHDMFSRADILVSYQSLDDLTAARQRLTELEASFPVIAPPSVDLFGDLESSLAISMDNDIPLAVRVRVLEQSRRELDDLAERAARKQLNPAPTDFWERFAQTTKRLIAAEEVILFALFSRQENEVKTWINGACAKLLAEAERTTEGNLVTVSDRIADELKVAYKHLTSIAPFVDGSVRSAQPLNESLKREVDRLTRTSEWLYNRQAMARMEAVKNIKTPHMEKLRKLASIREEKLILYVKQEFDKNWNLSFEELEDDQKLTAVKLRIMRQLK